MIDAGDALKTAGHEVSADMRTSTLGETMINNQMRLAVKQGLAGAGWIYAGLLTAKEAVGYLENVMWYEKLIPILFAAILYAPAVVWARSRIGKNSRKTDTSIQGRSSSSKETERMK